jgi:hypothetical protein
MKPPVAPAKFTRTNQKAQPQPRFVNTILRTSFTP